MIPCSLYEPVSGFITVWETTAPSELFTLPTGGLQEIEIDWGDGASETVTTDNPTHTYTEVGDHTITITGRMGMGPGGASRREAPPNGSGEKRSV